MSIVSQAQADGHTHCVTLAGPVPLEQFYARDALGWKYERGFICGPWRPATSLEELAFEAQGGIPQIGLQARDTFRCITCAEEGRPSPEQRGLGQLVVEF
jgi:hypothetical protein